MNKTATANQLEDVATLCNDYNRLTNPATLKTEDEHIRDNELARTIRTRLIGLAKEQDFNGKLFPR